MYLLGEEHIYTPYLYYMCIFHAMSLLHSSCILLNTCYMYGTVHVHVFQLPGALHVPVHVYSQSGPSPPYRSKKNAIRKAIILSHLLLLLLLLLPLPSSFVVSLDSLLLICSFCSQP